MKQMVVTIPEPCHEDWDQMTPITKGRYCGSCEKEVIDFTSMTDAQLVAFFKKPSTGSVCGRFMNEQLHRPINIPGKRIPWLRYFFQITVPAVLITSTAAAQGKVRKLTPDTLTILPQPKPEDFVAGMMRRAPADEQIQVVNEWSEGIPYATVELKSEKHPSFVADANGFLTLPAEIAESSSELVVSSTSYEDRKLKLAEATLVNGIRKIQMKTKTLPDVVTVVSYSTLRGKVVMGSGTVTTVQSDHFKLLDKSKDGSSNEYALSIFPNPSVPGGTINIDCKKMKRGYYILQILSITGQQLQRKTVWIDSSAPQLAITELPKLSGQYVINLSDQSTGKGYSAKLIIP